MAVVHHCYQLLKPTPNILGQLFTEYAKLSRIVLLTLGWKG